MFLYICEVNCVGYVPMFSPEFENFLKNYYIDEKEIKGENKKYITLKSRGCSLALEFLTIKKDNY